ncbi:MAG TPA: 3-hydroxyacyl-CoA dehydrogenase NAD-binding domain-containing protein [Longimicrobiales bacterium]|nr:3-hydroxyacyl-CoA dehydrogenase NAD-binding domain-containing protein [Longimicrobiales bacterium]
MDRSTPSAPTPTFHVDDSGIGWVTFDDPARKLNVLAEDVMRRLAEVLDEAREAAATGGVRVVVFRSGKPDSFMAGADVDAIASLEDLTEAERKIRQGQAIYMDVESLPVPTVAAIHGVCVGGGVELSLACRHRVLSDSPGTRVGLPEVMLGILPAWGGTTRLPRLVGLQAALDLLLTGKLIDARKARRIGFAAEVLPAELFPEKVTDFALRTLEMPGGGSRPKRGLVARMLDDTGPGRRIVLAAARKRVKARTGGHYPAPLRILEILRDHLGGSVDESLEAEARAAAELAVSPVCKNLIQVFRMREASRKGYGVADTTVEPRAVGTVAVLGAGVMGGGIAHLAARHGIRVRMKDIRNEAVTGGLQHARSLFDKGVERRKLTRREAAQRMELVSGGLDYAGFGGADVVVEAIVEKLDVKRAVLKEAERHVRPECVVATNTSSLSVDAMAGVLDRPERFCGMHFFNPVHRMPLVEVVRGARTSDRSVATVYALALRLGKVPVVVRDGPGFLVNRILAPYLNEAGFILGDGATVDEVDHAALDFGMPMGPLRLVDEVGIDVSNHAGTSLHEALGDRLAPAPALVALGASGRLGRKGGLGFYVYDAGKDKGVDPEVYGVLGAAVPAERGGSVAPEVIRRRLVIQMINEAARVLADGIVASAEELDLAMIMGTGFPPFRGGLLRFADTLHARGVLDRLRTLHGIHGERFAPARLLEELASSDRTFYAAFPNVQRR